MAERIYASRQTISNWETGRTYPDVQSLLLLSVAFNISIDKLIKGDVNITEETVRKTDHGLIWINAAEAPLTVAAIVSMFFAFDNLAGESHLQPSPFCFAFWQPSPPLLALALLQKGSKRKTTSLPIGKFFLFARAKSQTDPHATVSLCARIVLRMKHS